MFRYEKGGAWELPCQNILIKQARLKNWVYSWIVGTSPHNYKQLQEDTSTIPPTERDVIDHCWNIINRDPNHPIINGMKGNRLRSFVNLRERKDYETFDQKEYRNVSIIMPVKSFNIILKRKCNLKKYFVPCLKQLHIASTENYSTRIIKGLRWVVNQSPRPRNKILKMLFRERGCTHKTTQYMCSILRILTVVRYTWDNWVSELV
jgi:hypothetical protein